MPIREVRAPGMVTALTGLSLLCILLCAIDCCSRTASGAISGDLAPCVVSQAKIGAVVCFNQRCGLGQELSFRGVVSSFCHMPIHTEVAKTQFPKSESAHSFFEEAVYQPWRKLPD